MAKKVNVDEMCGFRNLSLGFDRKTLIQFRDKSVIVSTIGEQMHPGLIIDGFFGSSNFSEVGENRYYETVLFNAEKVDDHWICGDPINEEVMEQVDYCEPIHQARKEANRKHDDTVMLVMGMLKSGKL